MVKNPAKFRKKKPKRDFLRSGDRETRAHFFLNYFQMRLALAG